MRTTSKIDNPELWFLGSAAYAGADSAVLDEADPGDEDRRA